MNKWNGIKIDLSGKKAKITPAPKIPKIKVGDYLIVITKDGKEYNNCYVLSVSEQSVMLEIWNEVKDRTDEIDIDFKDIETVEDFDEHQKDM